MKIDASMVAELIAAQFPQWGDLAIRPVEPGGWDNRTFRLGAEMTVRLPSAARYCAQVEKEQRWLPILAPLLPLPIPTPLARGLPAKAYPWHWSVYRWIEGENATIVGITDPPRFAKALARFLVALQRIDPSGGPAPGPHNFFRGGTLAIYDAETRDSIAALKGRIDTEAVTAVWEKALGARWHGAPVWVHGDVSAGNLLTNKGQFSAIIDFGCCGVGDPACDLTIAWTLLSGISRDVFRAALPVDGDTWARARGWALWKGLITLADHIDTDSIKAETTQRVIQRVVADHRMAVDGQGFTPATHGDPFPTE